MEPADLSSPSKVILDDESKMSRFSIMEFRPKRRRRIASPTKGTKVCQKEEDLVPASTSEKESDDSSHEEEDRKPAAKRSKKARSKQQPVSCDHCGKEFTTSWGLKYHVDNLVCRVKTESESSGAPAVAAAPKPKRKRGKSAPPSQSKYKRLRGPEENRKCKVCGRVFTSPLGLKYHLEKKVCQDTGSTAKTRPGKNIVSFQTLMEGDEFVTPFGVLRVIKDDRAVPVAEVQSPKDAKKLNQQHRQAVARYEGQVGRYQIQRCAQLRRRREKINELYENGQVSQKSIFDAYSDPDAERMKFVAPEDPISPPDAFPDRIVECLLIADKRPYFDYNGEEQETRFQSLERPVKLYLRRRLLTEKYVEAGVVYTCEDCAQKFGNHPSWKYHSDHKPCQRRSQLAQTRRDESEKKILKAIEASREKAVIVNAPQKKRVWPKKKTRSLNYGLYPEVLIGLGFKLVAKDDSSRRIPLLPKTSTTAPEVQSTPENHPRSARVAARERVKEQSMASEHTDSVGGSDAGTDVTGTPLPQRMKQEPQTENSAKKEDEDPRILLEQVRRERRTLMSEMDRKRYGSMYPEVYESLGFYFPGTYPRTERNIIKVKKVAVPKKKKRKRRRTVPKPPPILPLAPIVDHKALVDEVLSGRYPSMKPFEGGEHMTTCSVCKKEGSNPLLCCNFCKHSEHMECLRTKFTTKAVEPMEDFMCHKCIGVIISRRNRAEKRRLGAYAKEKEVEDKQKEGGEEMGSTEDPRNGEYQLVAARGQETNELVELLTDSRIRLKQNIRQMEMNNLRRRMMMS